MLETLFTFCKKEGVIFCRLKNTSSFYEYAHMFGVQEIYDKGLSYNMLLEAVRLLLDKMGKIIDIIGISFEVGESRQEVLERIILERLPQRQ